MKIISARYAPKSMYPLQPPSKNVPPIPPVLVLATDDTGLVRGLEERDPNPEWQAYLASGGIIKPNTEPIMMKPKGLVQGPSLSEVFRS